MEVTCEGTNCDADARVLAFGWDKTAYKVSMDTLHCSCGDWLVLDWYGGMGCCVSFAAVAFLACVDMLVDITGHGAPIVLGLNS